MPLKKVVSDITEIQCRDGKLYVSAVLDCFNGEILALAMDDNMKKELCVKTIEQMKEQYGKRLQGMIFHSDRGSQYTSEAFKAALKSCGITQSLSGVGHCFDNARMESFWATLKKEKIYRIAAYKLTREQVKSIVFRYVFVYYNRIRIYTSNPYGLPPVKYRNWLNGCRKNAAWRRRANLFFLVSLRSTQKNRFDIAYISDLGDFSTAHLLTFPRTFHFNHPYKFPICRSV